MKMRKDKYFYRILGVILSLYLFACETRKPPFNRDYNNMLGVLTTLGPKRMSHAYNHSLLKMNRNYSDCIPECPRVDIWQYQYKPKNKAIIYDKKPISTLKKHWKIKDEVYSEFITYNRYVFIVCRRIGSYVVFYANFKYT